MNLPKHSHYEVLDKLGEGGMGVVYKAHDQRLDRLVALKMLSAPLLDSPEHQRRFVQEARAASALNHPNIVTIYEINTEPPDSFIAMEFIRGRTLDALISSRSLGLGDLIRIAIQVVDGLAAAHAGGVLHRDLKPANIMITAEGYVKLLDFGLARHRRVDLADQSGKTVSFNQQATTPGILLGTVAYMSPEQVEGAELDNRSDMFSFGSLLYEMFTGSRAFQGSSPISTLSSILRDQPRPPRELSPGVPPEIEAIIARCMEKDRNRRYSGMGEVKLALEASLQKLSNPDRRLEVTLSGSRSIRERRPSIAVLPFANMSPDRDNDYFSDGLSEEIITTLSQIEGLQVTARSSAFAFRGAGQDIRSVGEKLNVGTILEGSVRRAGNRVRVSAQLINVADGFHLWSERYDRELTDVFDIQEGIARAIAEKLKVRLTQTPSQPLVRRYTDDIEAYDLYLRGQYNLHSYTPEALARARACFEMAIRRDPDYAPAYVGLSYHYGALAWFGIQPPQATMPAALEMARRAVQIDDSLAEGQMILGVLEIMSNYNWAEGERNFLRALTLNPASTIVGENYAMHFLAPLGRLDEGLERLEGLVQLDPLSVSLHLDIGWLATLNRQPDRAIAAYRKALEISPEHFLAYIGIGMNSMRKGMSTEALEALEKARRLGPEIPITLSSLAGAYAFFGRKPEAAKILEELLRKSETEYVPALCLTYVYASLHDLDSAFRSLEKAVEEREGPVLVLNVDPSFDLLRPDPRFSQLLRKLRLQ
jgi:eukaryotic-like serine/threonine-protein kinase